PANDVGGDLLDYVPLGNERLGVVLGDVAGKGLGAALLMAKLQATLRAAAPEAEGPGALGARLNEILLRDGLDNRYATLLYFELEPGSGAVRYLNAGHPPPCLVRAARRGAPVETGSSVSPPLGMIPGARMIEQRLEASDGDLVLLYSDGLTEARNEQDEEFGGERLAALLPALSGMDAARAGERILEAVDRFLAGWRLHDDLTLVVLSRARRAV
ncbi:MAG TPA: PP2C family protein-serine/threonine phosphatase, partial [Candidatus Polarisedimenticolia bacterium]|nr:PP2C family protein-serine/threonine phosphatase [Candidatus Polarisedimenticolia bacterium]